MQSPRREERAPPQIATPSRASIPTVAILPKEEKPSIKEFLRSPSDYFPMIRRGQSTAQEEEKEVISTGWKVEVTSRKEREEALRYVSLIVSLPHHCIVYLYNSSKMCLLFEGTKLINLN